MTFIKRVRKWRTHKLLVWVKPGTRKYTIVVYRRINSKYQLEFDAVSDDINRLQFVELTYARTRLGAIFAQLMYGRDKWSDGVRQQVVTIYPPSYPRVIFRSVLTPEVSEFEFEEYPRGRLGDFRPTGNSDK